MVLLQVVAPPAAAAAILIVMWVSATASALLARGAVLPRPPSLPRVKTSSLLTTLAHSVLHLPTGKFVYLGIILSSR